MQTDAYPRVTQGIREKLEKVTGVRVLIVTLLLGSAVVLNLDDPGALLEPTFAIIAAIIVLTYLATLFYSVLIRYAADMRRLAVAQSIGDALLSGALVALTGGAESGFLFLYFLSIITAAYLLGRGGALLSASACSVVYTLIILLQQGHLASLAPLITLFGLVEEVRAPIAAVNLAALYTVALLAGHLADRLGQVGTELELRWTDIRQLRALNQNIVNSIAGGLCTIDLSDRIISFNRAAERIAGLTSTQVLGLRCIEVLPELALELERFKQQGGGRYRAHPELRLGRPAGDRPYVDLSIAPLHDATGRMDGYILYFADVTEVRRLQESMQRQRRMAAIGQLSASIAHEIRNPLASISGSIQVLREAQELGESERRLMGIVIREVDRLNELVEDFLAYARPRPLNRGRVQLKTLLDEGALLAQQNVELAPEVTFEVEVTPPGLTLDADADALRQVLFNLLRNSAEAIGGRGRIRLEAALLSTEDGVETVELRVSDDGPGLSDEVKGRLFEPFFTTKDRGTGLGLATAHRLVEAHGGMMWADETGVLGGATFRLRFPVGARGLVGASLAPSASSPSRAPTDELVAVASPAKAFP